MKGRGQAERKMIMRMKPENSNLCFIYDFIIESFLSMG